MSNRFARTVWGLAVLGAGLITAPAHPEGKPEAGEVLLEIPAGADFKVESDRVESRPVGEKGRVSFRLTGPATLTFSNGFRVRLKSGILQLDGEGSKGPFVLKVLSAKS